MQKATFAVGCFWYAEAAFRSLKGVMDTSAGYCGGELKYPSYEDVSTGTTGHVQAVQVKFDPAQISFRNLLARFKKAAEDSRRNSHGLFVGPQYRPVIYYYDEWQRMEAENFLQGKAEVEILPAKPFYRAEEYHQRYLEKRGLASYCV